jgi:D-3-phosphoglycerate dehydrogenase / 2-oxoglutarate reductase
MKNKILVTPRSLTKTGHPALDLLEKSGYQVMFCAPGEMPDENDLIKLLPDCVGYLAGVEPISEKALIAGKALKAISRNGTGIDNIDLKAAKQLNITILRAEGANARGVAELTISLLLSAFRHINFSDATIKSGKWERKRGLEVYHRTLGLIGFGKVGQLVARLAIALGMKVVAYDPFVTDFTEFSSDDFKLVSLEMLFEVSEVISLHCPPTENKQPIISEASIKKMKKGVVIINTARWELIDEKAVLKALNASKIGGLATDVFPSEPPELSPLINHPNVINTPHIGGFTEESVSKAASIAVENLVNHLSK